MFRGSSSLPSYTLVGNAGYMNYSFQLLPASISSTFSSCLTSSSFCVKFFHPLLLITHMLKTVSWLYANNRSVAHLTPWPNHFHEHKKEHAVIHALFYEYLILKTYKQCSAESLSGEFQGINDQGLGLCSRVTVWSSRLVKGLNIRL